MILPDVNLLVYAYNEGAPLHAPSRQWWEDLMTAGTSVGLPWAVTCGFVRLMTHPAVLVSPMLPGDAVAVIESWLGRDHVQILEPGPRHLALLREAFNDAGVAGQLTSDAHLAAIAIEHGCELHSNDSDFGRFSGLRWRNPLA